MDAVHPARGGKRSGARLPEGNPAPLSLDADPAPAHPTAFAGSEPAAGAAYGSLAPGSATTSHATRSYRLPAKRSRSRRRADRRASAGVSASTGTTARTR